MASRAGHPLGHRDPSSGFSYLRARWYNPATGTLLGRDPFDGSAESPYSQHPFQYGFSDPVSNTDPSGMCLGWIWKDPTCEYIGIDNAFNHGQGNRADALKVFVNGGMLITAVSACVATAGLGCAVIGGATAGTTSWANQAIDNAGQPVVDAAFKNINWQEVGVISALGFVTGPLAGRTGQGIMTLCKTGSLCTILANSAAGGVMNGLNQLVMNLADGNPNTDAFDNVWQQCAIGAIFGAVVGTWQARGNSALPPKTPSQPPTPFTITESQLKHSYNPTKTRPGHAIDFGITGNWNTANGKAFEQALRTHVDTAPVRINGTYRGTTPVTHYYNPTSRLWVAIDMNNVYSAGWKLSSDQIFNLYNGGNIQ